MPSRCDDATGRVTVDSFLKLNPVWYLSAYVLHAGWMVDAMRLCRTKVQKRARTSLYEVGCRLSAPPPLSVYSCHAHNVAHCTPTSARTPGVGYVGRADLKSVAVRTCLGTSERLRAQPSVRAQMCHATSLAFLLLSLVVCSFRAGLALDTDAVLNITRTLNKGFSWEAPGWQEALTSERER